jgi:hypothetical protein
MFRDFSDTTEITAKGEVEEAVTPTKRKLNDLGTPVEFPLTPPSTIKSEKLSKDEITEINEKFRRRSKRQKLSDNIEDPFVET